MLPFQEDPQLSAHLAELQPRQSRPRPPAKAKGYTTTGTLVYFDGQKGFVAPDGVDPRDKSQQLFLHHRALVRSGVSGIMVGARIAYDVKPSRFPGGKPECQSIEILEP
jgi:cold shock CspA family protein